MSPHFPIFSPQIYTDLRNDHWDRRKSQKILTPEV